MARAGCSPAPLSMPTICWPSARARACRHTAWAIHTPRRVGGRRLRQAGFDDSGEPIVCLIPRRLRLNSKYWSADAFATLRRCWSIAAAQSPRGVLVLCGPVARAWPATSPHAGRAQRRVAGGAPWLAGLTKACVRRADLLDHHRTAAHATSRRRSAARVTPSAQRISLDGDVLRQPYSLQKQVECGPCQLRTCPLDHRCMKLLTASEVFDAATALLRRAGCMPPSQQDVAA